MLRRLPLLLLLALALAAPAHAAGKPVPLRELDRVPADPSLPLARAVDLSGARAPAAPPDLGAEPNIPDHLKLTGSPVRASSHFGGEEAKRELYRDEHGHVLTLSTDDPRVDLRPVANLLASTYHYGEIEYLHVFVTSGARLRELCGSDAAACYAADDPERSPGGVMVVSHEDPEIVHGVVHEYGHHVDTNTYNFGPRGLCGTSGDGSRRWFFARERSHAILDLLSCDPRDGWGRLFAEVFAEDYAQMVGLPRSQYHPAILVPPPTRAQRARLKADMDTPFVPARRRRGGRSSSSGRATFSLPVGSAPVFVRAIKRRGVRSFRLRGCGFPGFRGMFAGRCKVVVRTKRRRAPYRLDLLLY